MEAASCCSYTSVSNLFRQRRRQKKPLAFKTKYKMSDGERRRRRIPRWFLFLATRESRGIKREGDNEEDEKAAQRRVPKINLPSSLTWNLQILFLFLLLLLFTSRCTSCRPPGRRRRPSWGRSCCPSPWRPCRRRSGSQGCRRSA